MEIIGANVTGLYINGAFCFVCVSLKRFLCFYVCLEGGVLGTLLEEQGPGDTEKHRDYRNAITYQNMLRHLWTPAC